MDSTVRRIGRWSVRLYAVLVVLYPQRFRAQFGDPMIQAFGDLVRDACNGPGLAGLTVVWVRTAGDLLVSVLNAYVREGRASMGRAALGAAILYAMALVFAVSYGATRFGEFYNAPGFTRFAATAGTGEDALIARYEQALAGDFGRYRSYAVGAGFVLALLLGIAAAAFGLWQRSALYGAGALLAGAVLTVAAVSLLPTIWFPFDRYPVGFVWLFRCSPVALVAWLLVTLAGRPGSGGLRTRAA